MLNFHKKINTIKTVLFLFVVSLSLFAFNPRSVLAKGKAATPTPTAVPTPINNVSPVQTSLTVSPPSYELTGNPGDTISNVIKLTNTSDVEITFESSVEDFKVEGQEGSVIVGGDDVDENAFSKWFSVSPSTVTLKPKEQKPINYTIKLPKDAQPGGHFASVLFNPKSISSNSGTGAQILQKVGVLVLMTVSGNIDEKGTVTSLNTKTFSGNWDTVLSADGKTKIYTAKNEDLSKESKKGYFDEGPVAFDLVLKNEGNVFYKPIGTLTIYDLFGRKVEEITVPPRNVFPGGERRITVLFPTKNLWGIYYKANFTAIYGSKNQTLSAETSFWAFPTTIAVIILVVLVVLVLLRKRLMKAISIIAKG